MITEIRLQWLRDNKIHGEVAKVVKKLNDEGNELTDDLARQIVNGKCVGEFGEIFCDALEAEIKSRQRREKRINKLYSNQ